MKLYRWFQRLVTGGNDGLTRGERLALRILANCPHAMYGLEIVSASYGSISRGSVYIHLDRLVRRGLVEIRPGPPVYHGGVRRHLYLATDKGRRFL